MGHDGGHRLPSERFQQRGAGDDGSYEQAVIADGRYIAFVSGASNLVPRDTNGLYDVFVPDG